MKKNIIIGLILGAVITTSGCAAGKTGDLAYIAKNASLPTVSQVKTTEDIEVPSSVLKEEVETKEQVLAETPIGETAVDEDVYSKKYINVRSGPGTEYDVLGTLNTGDAVHRSAVLDNGWSRVSYNDMDAYISSKLLTTEQPINEAENGNNEETANETVSVEVTGNYCTGEAKEIFDLTNAERAKAGLPLLQWSDELAECAAQRAAECVTVFSHTRPNGTPYKTINPSLMQAENLIRNGERMSPEFIVNAWMGSEGHRTNILYPTLGKIGIAVLDCEQGRVAVQEYGW